MSTGEQLSTPARVAELGEGISEDELQLASRNHGMPLEAMRYDVTPPGLHYLLIHYDIPAVDPDTWRLRLTGLVEHPLVLDLDTIRARPRTTLRVTMECAGNGRARLVPRPISQPWLVEAVGTAEWTGTSLAALLRDATPTGSASEVVFTGSDHGIERGIEQNYQRSLSLRDASDDDVLLVYEMNGAPLLPQHGFPLRLVVPGWYGMTQVKWLHEITVTDAPFTGYQQAAYRLRQDPDETGVPLTRMEPRALLIPPGWPDFMSRARFLHPGPVELRGRAWSGQSLGPRRMSSPPPATGPGGVGNCPGTLSPDTTRSARVPPTRPGAASPSSNPGTEAASQTTASSESPSSSLTTDAARRTGLRKSLPRITPRLDVADAVPPARTFLPVRQGRHSSAPIGRSAARPWPAPQRSAASA